MDFRKYTKDQGWLLVKFKPTESGAKVHVESKDSGAMQFHFGVGDELEGKYTLCMGDKTLLLDIKTKFVKG